MEWLKRLFQRGVSVEALLADLEKGPDPAKRRAAAEQLTRQAQALAAKLATGNPARRCQAARELGRLKRCALPALTALTQAERSPEPLVRQAARMARIQVLIDVVHKGSEAQKIQAIGALADIDDSRTLDPLLEALKSNAPDVVEAAAKALGGKGEPRVVGSLLSALDRHGVRLAPAICAALQSIGEPHSLRTVMALGRWHDQPRTERRLQKVVAAFRSGGIAEDALWQRLLERGDVTVVRHFLVRAGSLIRSRNVAALAQALADSGHDVVEELIAVLKIKEHLIDGYSRSVALEALKRIGDARAIEPLTALLGKASRRDVFQAAIDAIRQAQTAKSANGAR